jgi:RNA polymerase sigma-70 factor (ECF subfamily)
LPDWTDWFDQHGPALTLFARQFSGDGADAEDAVQDAFIRFWRAGVQRAEDPLAYLYSCVKRSALDRLRSDIRRRRREEATAMERPEAGGLFESDIEANEWADAVTAGLATLPQEQREVLVMKLWGRLTFPQIGAALEISPNTAAGRYRYGIAALRKALGVEPSAETGGAAAVDEDTRSREMRAIS